MSRSGGSNGSGGGTTHSQLPGGPAFRNSAMHAVAIVPLTIPSQSSSGGDGDGDGSPATADTRDTAGEATTTPTGAVTRSEVSFHHLLASLRDFASQGRGAAPGSSALPPSGGGGPRRDEVSVSEITLVLPHSQLTRPGDWRYDATPLKSHDWQSGCQRLRLFDGRPGHGRRAHDRLARSDPWRDLHPHRGTAAVLGVLNVRDCRDTGDLWRAEEDLMRWARRYAHPDDREDVALGAGDERGVLARLCVFDSFEESCQARVNLNQTRFQASQLVAFPPLDGGGALSQMMALHWNVVVNDLAVALFRNAERRIRENDALGKSLIWSRALTAGGGASGGSGHGNQAAGADAAATGDEAAPAVAAEDAPHIGVVGRWKKNFDNAVAGRREGAAAAMSTTAAAAAPGRGGGDGAAAERRRAALPPRPARARLTTPLDLDYAPSPGPLTARDAEALKRRDVGRREKRAADLSLLAGAPIDAYERYTRAAELTRHSHDPLWYAAALEGCAASFVAMADAGGHGADAYLEGNFQLPEEVMALAIARVHQDGGGAAANKRAMTVDRTKTTLPQAVTALMEEALSVLCRHEGLASLHADLLLKLAEYVQEEEEGHLRCRWGEGRYCYGGNEVSSTMGGSMGGAATDRPPRWDRTSVSKLDLRGPEVREMLALDSIERGRKFTELLHRALSVGGLDDWSRADVAATCARACLVGTKAAFFSLVAAEAMARQADENADAARRASSLYLAATRLYTRRGNACVHGEEGEPTRYGWATLRIGALRGLSTQPADKELAEAATELLVALLNEISANQGPALLLPQIGDDGVATDSQASFDSDYEVNSSSFGDDSNHGARGNNNTADSRQRLVSRPLASMAKTPFFSQAPPSALSMSQSKWLEDDPIPHVQLPFLNIASNVSANNNGVSMVNSMSCVTANINFEKCARMQQMCLTNIKDLRRKMAVTSGRQVGTVRMTDGGNLPSPLVITSAKIVKGDSHLLLERTKALGYSAKFATHSMSTFFNPYAKKQGEKEKNKVQTTLIAEGEERTIMIEFKNRLAVPLEVPSCQLEFEGNYCDRIEAPPLSFTVPAKTSSFAVHFPFIVAVSKNEPETNAPDRDKEEKAKNEGEKAVSENEVIPEPDIFDVVGLRVTCLNRTLKLRMTEVEDKEDKKNSNKKDNSNVAQLPTSAGVYQRSKHTLPKKDEPQMVVRLESVPAQPNLLVSFAASQTPMDEDTGVPVHLSDGEIFTIPSFRLENDFGRSGMGEIERLQVLAVGLPGIPEETLFDTDALAAALEEEEDVLTESDSEAEEDFEEMMECDGLPPLKMKVIAEGLNLRSINDKSKNKGEGNIVKFQMAATHDMGDQLANGGNVRIRFRYRGPSPNPATEIWRKREVNLRIIRVKGPRISSLTFRSDLSWGSHFSELCAELARQRRPLDTTSKWESSNSKLRAMAYSRSNISAPDNSTESVDSEDEVGHSILNRIGMDQCVHVSSDEVVLLMAVANETSSTIILSNRKGLVGGFEGSPMPTVRITSGVSVKIPVVIPRIDRFDENGNETDLAAELVSRTALQWESESVEGVDGTEKSKRTGRVRIPSRCLREIIDEHQSFASRICKPPVSLSVSLGGELKQTELSLPLGSAVQIDANMTIQDWVPSDVIAKCKITIEFCCAEKQPGNSSSANDDRMPYMWCGQLRRFVDLSNNDDDRSHLARIAFFQCGVYVVSACVKISSQDAPAGTEESWWAPHARVIRVGELEQ